MEAAHPITKQKLPLPVLSCGKTRQPGFFAPPKPSSIGTVVKIKQGKVHELELWHAFQFLEMSKNRGVREFAEGLRKAPIALIGVRI